MKKDIHDINSWPPGTFMLYDNREEVKKLGYSQAGMLSNGARFTEAFHGLGIVVANDGVDHIRVVWGANCHHQYLEYSVSTLNQRVIHHV